MTGLETIRLTGPGAGIAEITLDRPAEMNAVSSVMAAELTRACAQLAAAPEVRVVVFSAAGERAFSAGADLKERAGLTDEEIMRQRDVIRGLDVEDAAWRTAAAPDRREGIAAFAEKRKPVWPGR